MTNPKKLLEKTTYEWLIRLHDKVSLETRVNDRVGTEEQVGMIRKVHQEEIDLPKLIGVKGQKAADSLVKSLGEEVKKGELIAQKKGIFGVREAYAPFAGKLESLSEAGFLRIVFSQEEEIKSPFGGRVIRASKEQVVIEFPAWRLNGTWGIGEKQAGVLELVQDKEDEALFKMNADVAETILMVRKGISKSFWFKALSLGVWGVVCGRLEPGLKRFLARQWAAPKDNKELLPALAMMEKEEIEDGIWDKVKKYQGKKVTIDGQQACLVIPLSTSEV